MPFVFGWILGDALARITFSRAVLTLALWWCVAGAGYWLGYSNISHAAAPVTSALTPLALLGWAMWRPAASKSRIWLIEGILLWFRLAMWFFLIAILWRLWAVGFSLAGVLPFWRVGVAAVVAWVLQRALLWWVARDHVRAGFGNVAHEG